MEYIKKSLKQSFKASIGMFSKYFHLFDLICLFFIINIVRFEYYFPLNIKNIIQNKKIILLFIILIYLSRVFSFVFYNFLRNNSCKLFDNLKKYIYLSIYLVFFEFIFFGMNYYFSKFIFNISFKGLSFLNAGTIIIELFLLLLVFLFVIFLREIFVIYGLDNKNIIKIIKKSFSLFVNKFTEFLKFMPFYVILSIILSLLFHFYNQIFSSLLNKYILVGIWLLIVMPVLIFYRLTLLFLVYNLDKYPEEKNITYLDKFLII
ncbi:MAG TPA: hypothetical protein VKN74_04440 [Candidatus Mcinerneyibacterium sp.]|nr:hypothetical protein [Candidatus Mcinerneyibacterium sp.]